MPQTSKSPFSINVRDLIHRPGEYRQQDVEAPAPEDLGNAVIGVRKGEPVHIDARLEALHDGILVTADVDTVARGECVRCLIDVEQSVEVDIQELFAYSQSEAFEYDVQGDHVNLEPVVRDAVVLSLPFQPVCQDDCLGLCPQCGARLLDDPSHEHEAPVDPRWAALAGLENLLGPTTDDGIENDADRKKR